MTKTEDSFSVVCDVMKYKYMWFDQPNTFHGKLIKLYSFLRLLATLMMILAAFSQVYFYGMSYVLHDSFCLVPMGVLSLTADIHTALNFQKIVKTASQYQTIIDSFPERERAMINEELKDNNKKTDFLVKGLDYYVYGTGLTHLATILSHYFFGVPGKPVVLPLLYEKFLEGDLELRPMLISVAVLSVIYIHLLNSFSGYLCVSLYVMKCNVAIMKALTHRMELMTRQSGKTCEKLPKPMELRDTIRKHGELIQVSAGMVSWNAFPLLSVANFCILLFCAASMTVKQALNENELSTAAVWGSFLVFCCIILYTVCFHGQEVQLQSEELLTAIYGLPWYRYSPRSRKDVVLMIAQGNRLIKIHYRGMVDINMVKYLDVVQTAYSYFMILSSVNT